MDKRDYIIFGLVLLIVISASVLITRHFTKQDIELKYNSRNDSLEQVNNQLTSEAQRLRLELRDLQQALIINEIGTEQNKQNYKKKVSQIKEQNSNEDYEEVTNYLNSYPLQ